MVDDFLFFIGALALPTLLGYFGIGLIAPLALALTVTAYNVSVGWRWSNLAIGWRSSAVVGFFLAAMAIFPMYLIGFLLGLLIH